MGLADDPRRQALGVSAGRTLVGIAALSAPVLTGRLFGFPREDINPSTMTLARLFGVREVAIGAANLLWLSRREPTRALAALNFAVDGGDATVALGGLAGRNGRAAQNVMMLLVALPFAALWARMALTLRAEPSSPG